MKKAIVAAATALTLACPGAMAAPPTVTWTFDWSGTLIINPPQNCDPEIFVCDTEVDAIDGRFVLTEPVDYNYHYATTPGDGNPWTQETTIIVRHGRLIEYADHFDDLANFGSAYDLSLTDTGGSLSGSGYIGPWQQYSTSEETYTLVSRVGSIPEPASVALMLAGLGLVGLGRRKAGGAIGLFGRRIR